MNIVLAIHDLDSLLKRIEIQQKHYLWYCSESRVLGKICAAHQVERKVEAMRNIIDELQAHLKR